MVSTVFRVQVSCHITTTTFNSNLTSPVRISPATAKFKAPASLNPIDLARAVNGFAQMPPQYDPGVPLQTVSIPPQKSVTASVAFSPTNGPQQSFGPAGDNQGVNGLVTPSPSAASSNSSASSTLVNTSVEDAAKNLPPNVVAQLAQYATGNVGNALKSPTATLNSITSPFASQQQSRIDNDMDQKYIVSEESWKHHAQARAILSNLIGPNGEQLTSMDPYNTTVFVGGLSPLISEDTLRTFFAPFGDIHYVRSPLARSSICHTNHILQVKVPVGKHCGFVQFVRKADAERAIEKMQGFPIGGSRIRLSWGRSQCTSMAFTLCNSFLRIHRHIDKAAQAAAQAAQAAAMQAHLEQQLQAQVQSSPTSLLTQEQAMQLLQRFNLGPFSPNGGPSPSNDVFPSRPASGDASRLRESEHSIPQFDAFPAKDFASNMSNGLVDRRGPAFSPFSPDPNIRSQEGHQGADFSHYGGYPLPHPSKRYAPGFVPTSLDIPATSKVVDASRNSSGKVSPVTPTSRPASSTRYGPFADAPHQVIRMEESQSRPPGARTYSYERQRMNNLEDVQDDNMSTMSTMQDLNGTLASLDLDGHGYARSNLATTA
jgi:RNA recognition motif-containing protein